MKNAIFGRKASSPLQVGDLFMKAGIRFGTVWEVSRLWTAVDGLPHARLNSLEYHRETMVVSVVTLNDRQFFAPVPKPASRG